MNREAMIVKAMGEAVKGRLDKIASGAPHSSFLGSTVQNTVNVDLTPVSDGLVGLREELGQLYAAMREQGERFEEAMNRQLHMMEVLIGELGKRPAIEFKPENKVNVTAPRADVRVTLEPAVPVVPGKPKRLVVTHEDGTKSTITEG